MSMSPLIQHPQLVIEYVFEGQQRGYNFTSATRGYADETLKIIWRSAMPRGQGWSACTGAASLKCFLLPDRNMAVSQVTVTDQQDESGRKGIRRAVIDVVSPSEYDRLLRERLLALPAGIQKDADYHLEEWRRTRMLERLAGKLRKAGQLVLSHKYTTPADWLVVEAVILKLTLTSHPVLRTLKVPLNFTTMALEYRDEAPLVGLPADRAAKIQNIPVLPVI
jgi:hypothetical protein